MADLETTGSYWSVAPGTVRNRRQSEDKQGVFNTLHKKLREEAKATREGMGPRQVARRKARVQAARVQPRPAPVPAPAPVPVAVAAPVAAPVPAPAPAPAPVPVFREICRACSKPCDGFKVVFRLGSYIPMCSDYCVQVIKEDGF